MPCCSHVISVPRWRPPDRKPRRPRNPGTPNSG
jgi:hypothetical protein